MNDDRPILFLADLHGHGDLFSAAIAEGRRRAGREDLLVVAAGDFCDNGPSTPELVDRCLEFAEAHPGSFLPVLGNHDLACLLTLGLVPASQEASPEEARAAWWERWKSRYPNGKRYWTPSQYGAESLSEFEERLPEAHRAFFAGLPWYRELNGYLFVHAGLEARPVRPQLESLARRSVSHLQLGFQPPQIREKSLATINHPEWGAVVVSGHTKLPDGKDFLASHRLTLHSASCRGEGLRAALLPAQAPPEGLREDLVERFQVGP